MSILSAAHYWAPHIEYVVKTLEGCTEAGAVEHREVEVCQKLKEVVFSNLRSDNPLEQASLKTFEIVNALGCIDSCSNDMQEFECGVQKLADMLNPNGYLICMTSLGAQWWSQGDSPETDPKLLVMSLQADNVQRAMEKAGLTILAEEIFVNPKDNVFSAIKSFQFVIAEKKFNSSIIKE